MKTTTAAEIARNAGITATMPYAHDTRGRCFSGLWKRLVAKNPAMCNEVKGEWSSFNLTLGAVCLYSEDRLVRTAAQGLSRSFQSARLCPVAAWKISTRSPFQVCELLAEIAAELAQLPEGERHVAAVDDWLRTQRERLAA